MNASLPPTPATSSSADGSSTPEREPGPVLPVVAVVDVDLVTRRRRIARPIRYAAMAAVVVLIGLANTVTDELALGWQWLIDGGGLVVCCALIGWSLPWSGTRTGATWVVGIETDGLRIQHPLAADGQAALPWAAIAAVRRVRYLGICPAVRVSLVPDAGWALGVFDPTVRNALQRRGILIGLQGSSMTPRELVRIATQVGGTRPG